MTRDNGLPQTMNDQVEDPWVGVNVDLVALQSVVCQVIRVSKKHLTKMDRATGEARNSHCVGLWNRTFHITTERK